VVEEIILAKHATKEFVGAGQVAAFVVMLCTEAGASTTGAAIPIDGGWTAA
jgi:3-hydroxybutyrate dehydrogenase